MQSPRINVSLDQSVYDVVSRIASASKISRSALVADIVSANTELLTQLADILEQANMLSEAVKASLEPDLFRAEVATQDAVNVARTRLDELQAGILHELQLLGIKGAPVRAAAESEASAGGCGPLAINKGARNPHTKGSK